MAKTDPAALRAAVTEELITYLGAGTINQERYAEAIDYAGLQIENFEQLKRLHFVLAPDVVEYVERIPEWIRRVKTVMREQTETVRGEVRGSIDWRRTHQTRAKAGYDDPTLFVVHDAEIEYDIPENRVVKKLLAAIAEPLTNNIEPIDYEWRAMWDDQDIIELQQLLAHDLYLDARPHPKRSHCPSGTSRRRVGRDTGCIPRVIGCISSTTTCSTIDSVRRGYRSCSQRR